MHSLCASAGLLFCCLAFALLYSSTHVPPTISRSAQNIDLQSNLHAKKKQDVDVWIIVQPQVQLHRIEE